MIALYSFLVNLKLAVGSFNYDDKFIKFIADKSLSSFPDLILLYSIIVTPS